MQIICNVSGSRGLNCGSLQPPPGPLPGATNTHTHSDAKGKKAERWGKRDTAMWEKDHFQKYT